MSSYDVDIWFAVKWKIKYPNSLQTIYKGGEREGQNGGEEELIWVYMTIYSHCVSFHPYVYKSINCKRLNIPTYDRIFKKYSNIFQKDFTLTKILLIWSLYYSNQQKSRQQTVGFCKKLQNQWIGHCSAPLNIHLLIWLWFSSSVSVTFWNSHCGQLNSPELMIEEPILPSRLLTRDNQWFVNVQSAMVSWFCVRRTSKRWFLKIVQVAMKHDPFNAT